MSMTLTQVSTPAFLGWLAGRREALTEGIGSVYHYGSGVRDDQFHSYRAYDRDGGELLPDQ